MTAQKSTLDSACRGVACGSLALWAGLCDKIRSYDSALVLVNLTVGPHLVLIVCVCVCVCVCHTATGGDTEPSVREAAVHPGGGE